MTNKLILAAVALVLAGGAYAVFRPDATPPTETAEAAAPADGSPLVEIVLPDTLSDQALVGQNAFNAVCAACHGENAVGRLNYGPPLIHKIYEPNHHSDMAFQLAVQRGVVAHHWKFGNMPAQEGLTQGDVKNIVAFVREVQSANGIE